MKPTTCRPEATGDLGGSYPACRTITRTTTRPLGDLSTDMDKGWNMYEYVVFFFS